MSLGTGKAQLPFGRSRAGSRAMAAQLAKVHFQPLPPSVITLSDAQIARIKG